MPAPARITQLYDDHAEALYAFALNLCGHPSDAEDLLQAIFARLIEKPNLLETVQHPRTYLLTALRRQYLDRQRQHSRRQRRQLHFCKERAPFLQPDLPLDAEARHLENAIASLSDEHRQLVHLRIWEELTFEQIAGVFDIPKLKAQPSADTVRHSINYAAHFRTKT